MIVHVLGNGLSIQHTHIPQAEIKVTCNLGHKHLNCAWTFVNPAVLFYVCEQQIDFKIPIVAESNCLKIVVRTIPNAQHLKRLSYYSIIKPFKTVPTPTTGHKATYYAISLYKPTTLHLWGMDFLWTQDNVSLYDDVLGLRKDDTFFWSWRPAWHKLWSINPKTQFVIHTPTPIENLPKNVVTEML